MNDSKPAASAGRGFTPPRKRFLAGLLVVAAASLAVFVLCPPGRRAGLARKMRKFAAALPHAGAGRPGRPAVSTNAFPVPAAPVSTGQAAVAGAPVPAGTNKQSGLPAAAPAAISNAPGKALQAPATNAPARPPAGKPPARPAPAAPAAAKPPAVRRVPAAVSKTNAFTRAIPQDVSDVLDEIERTEWSFRTEKMLLDAINRWAQQDPLAAFEYAVSLDRRFTRRSAAGNVLGTWAAKSPEEAYLLFESVAVVNPALVEGYTSMIFTRLAEHDLALAADRVWSLPTTGMRQAALATVTAKYVAKGRDGDLLGMCSALGDGPDKNLFADIIIQQLGRYRPAQLGNWVASFQDENARKQATDTLVSVWAADHPAEAAKWVAAELYEGPDRARQIAKVTESWVREDPVETAMWLRSLSPPSAQTDPAVGILARAVVRNNPGAALAWAGAVYDPGQRRKLLQEIAVRWKKEDPAGLRNYASQPALPPEDQKLLQQILDSP